MFELELLSALLRARYFFSCVVVVIETSSSLDDSELCSSIDSTAFSIALIFFHTSKRIPVAVFFFYSSRSLQNLGSTANAQIIAELSNNCHFQLFKDWKRIEANWSPCFTANFCSRLSTFSHSSLESELERFCSKTSQYTQQKAPNTTMQYLE